MSQLIYAGIELSLIKTNIVQRTSIYHPDDSEYMYTEFLIDIVATYSPSSLATSYSLAGIQEPGHLPMTTDVAIRHELMQPRRGLLFAEGGLTIVEVLENALGEAIDARNGPQPVSCDIRRITGSRLWYVSYSIKTWLVECPFLSTAENPIASARYSRQEELDSDYLSTLTTRGIAFFRSDILAALGKNADEFRGRLIPMPMLGYQRTHLQFMLGSDGTSIEWITIDRERKQDLGNTAVFDKMTAGAVGITDMSLNYNVSSLRYGSEFKMAWGSIVNIEVTATGQKHSNNLDILKFCVTAAVNRLGSTWKLGILSDATISDNFFDHIVMLSLTFTIMPSDEEGMLDIVIPIVGFVGQPIVALPETGGENPFPPFEKATRGHAAYQLAVKAFATACFSTPDQNIDDTGTIIPPGSYDSPSLSGTSPAVSGFYSPTMPPSYSTRQPSLGRAVPNLATPPSPPSNQPDPSPQSPQQSPQKDEEKTTDTRISGDFFMPIAFKPSSPSTPTPTPTSSWGQGNDAMTASQSGSTPPSGVVIRIHQPYSVRNIVGQRRQNAGLPVIPDPIPPAQRDDPKADSPLWLITSAITTEEIDVLPNGSTPVFGMFFNYSYVIRYDETARTQMSYNKPSWIKTQNVFSITTEPNEMSSQGDYVSNQINEDFNPQQEEPWF